MKRTLIAIVVLAACSSIAGPAAPTAKQAFDGMKKLVGEWEGSMDGTPGAKVIYKLTGGGSALVETLGPGTQYEMVSVYHMDKSDLLMTHYCGAGNQPTMKYKPGKDANNLSFEFVRGTNMKSTDMHMHKLTVKMISADKIQCDWTSYSNGKAAGTAKFEFKRVAPKK